MNESVYLIAGMGKTGRSIAKYLERRNQSFMVFDTRLAPEGLEEFKRDFPDAPIFLGDFPAELFPQIKEIIASPGLSLDEPVLTEAFSRQISVIGDIECLAREIKVPVIAITGTNGKSTVTTLVGEMAKKAGITTAVAGNIGAPVLDLLDDGINYDLWVLELSSFQLDLIQSLSPKAATVLNVTPDHLDRHHSLEAYQQAKLRIYQKAHFCLYNRDDLLTVPVLKASSDQSHFGLSKPQTGEWGIVNQQGKNWLAFGDKLYLSVDELCIKGRHNWQNALAASALAHAVGIDFSVIEQVLKNFAGLPHRCQWVRSLDQVEWINDSKGTNVGAAVSAIAGIGAAIEGKIVLIAGGLGKDADFTELRSSVSEYIRAVILLGQDAPLIEQALADVTTIHHATSLDEAVVLARRAAIAKDVVLLSPACASFDMFKDFNHRGECFTEAVRRL